jgi:Flp pilus assembly protein TadB
VKLLIDILLFVLLFCLSYFLVYYINVFQKSDKYKKRNNIQNPTKENSLKNFFSKINFISSKENFLSKQGYPLKLHAISYYFIKIFLALILLCAGVVNYKSFLLGVILGIFGFFTLDIYVLLNKRTRNNEICVDLLNVVDSVILQLSAEVSLKDSLRQQYQNCKNESFRKAILEFSTQYELSELNIDASLDELQNKFDVMELNMFCNSLKEYNKVGNIIEILENLSDTLKIKYLDKIKEDTRTKVLYMTLGVVLALGNIILITFYPLFISIGQGFNNIFS